MRLDYIRQIESVTTRARGEDTAYITIYSTLINNFLPKQVCLNQPLSIGRLNSK